tara:strand:+ start:498 stop:773 length:276 start_codon:yes stop_codon:yes gene_type:complete
MNSDIEKLIDENEAKLASILDEVTLAMKNDLLGTPLETSHFRSAMTLLNGSKDRFGRRLFSDKLTQSVENLIFITGGRCLDLNQTKTKKTK